MDQIVVVAFILFPSLVSTSLCSNTSCVQSDTASDVSSLLQRNVSFARALSTGDIMNDASNSRETTIQATDVKQPNVRPVKASVPNVASVLRTGEQTRGWQEISKQPNENVHLSRRAVYVHWGARFCPFGSKTLYSGLMASSYYADKGSGYNFLCLHPHGQMVAHPSDKSNGGARLFGVEYAHTGALTDNLHQYKEAACAVCQWQQGATVYVDWGRGEKNHEGDSVGCSNSAHEKIYDGLVMSSHFGHHKSENICVNRKRESHKWQIEESEDEVFNGGMYLVSSEMKAGGADEWDVYPENIEVGCMVCGIRARPHGSKVVSSDKETDVFTVWGSSTCPSSASKVYTGVMTSADSRHNGGGANYICMTEHGTAPYGASASESHDGNRLYAAEYNGPSLPNPQQDGHDVACTVCALEESRKQVYIQWGRAHTCTSHDTIYSGLIMASHVNFQKTNYVCVNSKGEAHEKSHPSNHHNPLYVVEVPAPAQDLPHFGYQANEQVGCSACAGHLGKSIFTRWGSKTCPNNSSLVYLGVGVGEHNKHPGSGANMLCLHSSAERLSTATTQSLASRMYGARYRNTGTDADKNHGSLMACAVCELNRWETVYTQWGRSTKCTNGHETLYTGVVMAAKDKVGDETSEYLCVDKDKGFHNVQDPPEEALLWATEFLSPQLERASKAYEIDLEAGCSVCAAHSEGQEPPFAIRPGNYLHGQWVYLKHLHIGAEFTLTTGFSTSEGTSLSEEETQEQSHATFEETSKCFTSSYEESKTSELSVSRSFKVSSGIGTTVETGGEVTATTSNTKTRGYSDETCKSSGDEHTNSIGQSVATSASWDTTTSGETSESFSLPDAPPPGTPDTSIILTYGVHLWQWQWEIQDSDDGSDNLQFQAKAKHYVYSPNDPEHEQPLRPCCLPGEEVSMWHPFHCKTSDGFIAGAAIKEHCHVGPPSSLAAHIATMTISQVVSWFGSLKLSKSYETEIQTNGLDGAALAQLAAMIDKGSWSSGSDPSKDGFYLVEHILGMEHSGDVLKIMNGLMALLHGGAETIPES